MHKLLVFDLDGTLAQRAKGIGYKDIQKLKELEKSGYRIAICSGKPTYYLCGFARQLELENPILIGENGGSFQFGVALPPKKYYKYPYSKRAGMQLAQLRKLIDEKCGEYSCWYQPNEIELTPFPQDAQTFEIIQKIIDSGEICLDELLVYRHKDCFDMIPKNINKANGVALLAEREDINRDEIIAFGDEINDIPMLGLADISVLIGDNYNLGCETDYRFGTISEALDFILKEKL